MFVFSVKADRKQLAWGSLCLVAVAAAITVSLALSPKDLSVGSTAVDLRVASAEERVQLLEELGHRVDGDTERVEEIRIPDEADATLIAYDEMQPQGMGLQAYGGKRVKCYTYTVVDSDTDKTMWAHLYVYRDRVVAGDITAADPEGVQQPLM